MKKSGIIALIDRLFISFCIFLLLYAWINFYIRNLFLTFIVSIILTFSIMFLVYSYLNKKNEDNKDLSKVRHDIDRYFTAYTLLPNKEKLNLLYSILACDYNVTKNSQFIIYKKDNLKIALIPFSKALNTDQDLMSAICEVSNLDAQKIIVICNNYSSCVNTNILHNKKIEIVDKTKLYTDFFLRYQIYPDVSNIIEQNQKIKIKDVLTQILSPKKTKAYFYVGFVLLFSSLIIPFKTYYLIMGSVFLILTLLSKIIPSIRQHRSQ